MADITIQATPNGPYKVTGDVELLDAEGNRYDLKGRTEIYLCRCGGSNRKPFCDSSHEKVGFSSEPRAGS